MLSLCVLPEAVWTRRRHRDTVEGLVPLPPLLHLRLSPSSHYLTDVLGQVAGPVVQAAPLFLVFLQHLKESCSGLSLRQVVDQQKSGQLGLTILSPPSKYLHQEVLGSPHKPQGQGDTWNPPHPTLASSFPACGLGLNIKTMWVFF